MQLPDNAGQGGRMQHFALALLQQPLPPELAVLAVSSDGVDGIGDAAGILLSASQIQSLRQQQPEIVQALSCANSYAFWQRYGGQLFCSTTETNVMDLVAILKE
jgi:glycerate-2-kinase